MKRTLFCSLFLALIFSTGCISQPKNLNTVNQYRLTSLMIPLVTHQDAILEGIPLLVTSHVQSNLMLEQEFILKAWTGKKYFGIVGSGRLQEDGILWIEFANGSFKAQAGKKYVFWVMPKDPDKIGVKEIIFLADYMFLWNGDDPKNPPE